MEKPAEWIHRKVEELKDVQAIYEQYETFQKETGSTAALDSFKRSIRRKYFEEYAGGVVDSAGVQIKTEVEGPNQNIVTTSSHIRTLDQLLAYTRVDLNVWEITKHVVNSWGSDSNENFQVKAWMRLRDGINEINELDALIEEAKQYAPVYPPIVRSNRPDSGYMFELSIYDHHFGQLAWGEETGGNDYNLDISRKLALEAVGYQLARAEQLNPEKIVIIIGNDFFNVNNKENTTSHGTPQSEADRWHRTFVSGRRLWVEIIEMCLQVAPVDIMVILGNHDEERAFYLGDALDCWFHNAEEVTVKNGPKKRKYYEWGLNLLGYTHGNEERKGKGVLPNLMAMEQPMAWSRTKYRTWRKGHVHAANALAFQVLDEELGVREEVMPSMVGLDDYHAGKGYSHLRETIGNMWHKQLGRTDQFMYHPSVDL